MNKNKIVKIVGGIVGVVLIILILFLAINNSKGNTTKNTKSTVMLDNFYKYMESPKTKVIYYGSNTCGYCELETPVMKQIKKDYKLDYLYIDADKLSKEDKKKIIETLDIEGSTPTIAVVKNDEVIDVNEGYLDGKQLVKFLSKNGAIKKDAVYTPEEYLTDIDYSEYEELIAKDEMSVIVIGQTTCSHCIAVKPVLNHVAKEYDVTINYLNLTEMEEDEQTKLTESLKNIGYENAENLGTPLTLLVKSNHLEDKIEGENPPSYFIRRFKKAGVIKSDE